MHQAARCLLYQVWLPRAPDVLAVVRLPEYIWGGIHLTTPRETLSRVLTRGFFAACDLM